MTAPALAPAPRPAPPVAPNVPADAAPGDLDPAFYAPLLARALRRPGLRVDAVRPIGAGPGASIVGDLTAERLGEPVGVVHRRVHHAGGLTDVVVKHKATDTEVHAMLGGLAHACGRRLGAAFAAHAAAVGFVACHRREPAVYAQRDPRVTRHVPRCYGVVRRPESERPALVLERLGPGVRLLDSADDPSGWGGAELEAALDGLGALHAVWLGREAALRRAPWIGAYPTAARMAAARPLWHALADHAAERLPDLMPPHELRRQRVLLGTLPDWWAAIDAMPRTLAHNDCNPRNVTLRDPAPGAPAGAPPRLCAYDWELATLHLPQRDAAELLAFVLPDGATRGDVLALIERHRRATAAAGAAVPDAAAWRAGFVLAARDLLVHRLALYTMGHPFQHYRFLARCLRTARRLLDLELDRP